MIEKCGDSGRLGDPFAAATMSDALRREPGLKLESLRNALKMSVGLSIMVTDSNGLIQLFNLGAERMLGYSAVEMVDRINVIDLHDPPQLEIRARAVSRELSVTIARGFEAMTCKASRQAEDCYTSVFIAKNRQPVPVDLVIAGMRDTFGHIDGYLLILNDLSVPAQAPVEPHEARSPGKTADVAELALLANMSHEMRTPLSAILGFSQLMESATPPPTASQKKSLDRILQAGWHLQHLINMTSDLALIETGKLTLSPGCVPLAEVMLDVAARIEPQARMRRVGVTFPSFATPCFVSADRQRVQQVLDNLLFAAIEYSPLGGAVVVDCDMYGPEWIRIGISDGRDALNVASPTHLPEQVACLENERTGVAGSDIALLLAWRLVELMGAAIGPECSVGSRKVFSVDLKCMPTHAAGWHETRDSRFNVCNTPAPGAITRQIT